MSIGTNNTTSMVELNVLNGTEIDLSTYVNLVQRYRHFAKEFAANIVKLAETLVIAKHNLAPVHFDKFCDEVGLHKDGSTYRKLMKIGENASRFEPFYDRLPNAWTTVYKLASIKQNEFDRVTKSEQFSPFMTAKDVTEVLGRRPSIRRYQQLRSQSTCIASELLISLLCMENSISSVNGISSA